MTGDDINYFVLVWPLTANNQRGMTLTVFMNALTINGNHSFLCRIDGLLVANKRQA